MIVHPTPFLDETAPFSRLTDFSKSYKIMLYMLSFSVRRSEMEQKSDFIVTGVRARARNIT